MGWARPSPRCSKKSKERNLKDQVSADRIYLFQCVGKDDSEKSSVLSDSITRERHEVVDSVIEWLNGPCSSRCCLVVGECRPSLV